LTGPLPCSAELFCKKNSRRPPRAATNFLTLNLSHPSPRPARPRPPARPATPRPHRAPTRASALGDSSGEESEEDDGNPSPPFEDPYFNPAAPPPLPLENEDEASAAARFATYPAWRLRAELRWRQADDAGEVPDLALRLASLIASRGGGSGGGGGGFGVEVPEGGPTDPVINAMTAVEMRGVLRAWGVPPPKTKSATLARLRAVLDGGWRPAGGVAASAAAAAAAAAAGEAIGGAGPPPSPRPTTASSAEGEYVGLKAPELRAAVRARGLATSGAAAAMRKAALVALLASADAAAAAAGAGDAAATPPLSPSDEEEGEPSPTTSRRHSTAAAPKPAPPPPASTDIAAWTAPELAAALRARGARTGGRKAELVARLRASLAEEAAAAAVAGGLAAGGGGDGGGSGGNGARALPSRPLTPAEAAAADAAADMAVADMAAAAADDDTPDATVMATLLTPTALAVELTVRGLAPSGASNPLLHNPTPAAMAAARATLAAALAVEEETGRTTRPDIFKDDTPSEVADASDPGLVAAYAALTEGGKDLDLPAIAAAAVEAAAREDAGEGAAAAAAAAARRAPPPRARVAVLMHWPASPSSPEPLAATATLLELLPSGAGRDAFGGAVCPETAAAVAAAEGQGGGDAALPGGVWVDAWLLDAGCPDPASGPVTRAKPATLLASADPGDVSAALALLGGGGGEGEQEVGGPAPATLPFAEAAALLAASASPPPASPAAPPTVAFPMLQGAPAGGAALLAALDRAGVPYVGPTPAGAATCADKGATSDALTSAGLAAVPRAELVVDDWGGEAGLAAAAAAGASCPPPPAAAAKVEALLRLVLGGGGGEGGGGKASSPPQPFPPDGAGLPLVVKLSDGRGGHTARLVSGISGAVVAAAAALGGNAATTTTAARARAAVVEPFLGGAVQWRVLVIGTDAGPVALTPAEVDLSSPEFDVADAAAGEEAAAAAVDGWAPAYAAAIGAAARTAARLEAGSAASLYSPSRRAPAPGAGDARPSRLRFPPRLPVEAVRAIRSAAAHAAGALGARDFAVVDGWAALTAPPPPAPPIPPLDIDLGADAYVAKYPDRPDEAVPDPHSAGPEADVALRMAAGAARAAALASAAPAPPAPVTEGGGHAIMVSGVDTAPPLGEADFAFACAADAGITHAGLLRHLVSRARARVAEAEGGSGGGDGGAGHPLSTPLPPDRLPPALWASTALARDAGAADVPEDEDVGEEDDLRADALADAKVGEAWADWLGPASSPPPGLLCGEGEEGEGEGDGGGDAAAARAYAAGRAAWAAAVDSEGGAGAPSVSALDAIAAEANASFAADAAAVADLAAGGVWGGAGEGADPASLGPAALAAVAEGYTFVDAGHGRSFNSALALYGARDEAEPGGFLPPFDLVKAASYARPPPAVPGRALKEELLARAGAPPPRWVPAGSGGALGEEGAEGAGAGEEEEGATPGFPRPSAWVRPPPLPSTPPPTPPPLRVWVLFGGDGPDRHASLAAGVHAWLSLGAAGGGVLAEPFLLAPAAGGGVREPARRATLLGRRATLLRAGVPEDRLPAGLSLEDVTHPAPEGGMPPHARAVYALTPCAALRSWADDAADAAEADAYAACVAPPALPQAVLDAAAMRASTLAQLDTAGVAAAGGAWGEGPADRVRAAGWAATTPGAPLPASPSAQPSCRCLAVHELGEEAAAAGAVILLALGAGEGGGGDGSIAWALRAAGAVVTGPDAFAAARVADVASVGAALADLEVHSVSTPPRAVASAADLADAAGSEEGADALLARLRAGVGGSPGPLRARPGAGGTACGAGADAVIEDAAALRAFAAAAASRARTLPDGRGGWLEAPAAGLDGALFEPGVPPDGAVLLDGARSAEWATPRNRWLRAAVALVGEGGAMRALTPTVAVADKRGGAGEEGGGGGAARGPPKIVLLTPPPPSLARPDAIDGARARCELVADRLGLTGGAVLGCYIHADTADVIVSDVAAGGAGAGVGGPGGAGGSGGGSAGLVARGGPLLRQALAEDPPVHAPEVLRELVRLAWDEAVAAVAAAAAAVAAEAAEAVAEAARLEEGARPPRPPTATASMDDAMIASIPDTSGGSLAPGPGFDRFELEYDEETPDDEW